MKISAIVTLKKEVLDPQGKVIKLTLGNMGIENIKDIRQGKYFEIDIEENNPQKAKNIVKDICEKLLTNLVIEDYKIL